MERVLKVEANRLRNLNGQAKCIRTPTSRVSYELGKSTTSLPVSLTRDQEKYALGYQYLDVFERAVKHD